MVKARKSSSKKGAKKASKAAAKRGSGEAAAATPEPKKKKVATPEPKKKKVATPEPQKKKVTTPEPQKKKVTTPEPKKKKKKKGAKNTPSQKLSSKKSPGQSPKSESPKASSPKTTSPKGAAASPKGAADPRPDALRMRAAEWGQRNDELIANPPPIGNVVAVVAGDVADGWWLGEVKGPPPADKELMWLRWLQRMGPHGSAEYAVDSGEDSVRKDALLEGCVRISRPTGKSTRWVLGAGELAWLNGLYTRYSTDGNIQYSQQPLGVAGAAGAAPCCAGFARFADHRCTNKKCGIVFCECVASDAKFIAKLCPECGTKVKESG